MNFFALTIHDETIDGKVVFYVTDEKGHCLFNKDTIFYAYSEKDIINHYKQLNKADKNPSNGRLLDIQEIRAALKTAISFEKEIEMRDASERIVKEITHLYPFVSEEAETLQSIQYQLEKLHREAEDGIVVVDHLEGRVS